METEPRPDLPVEQLDFLTCVDHAEAVPADQPLGQVYTLINQHDLDYVAVCDRDRFLGLCSRRRVGFLMASRYGFAIYSRQPIRDHLLANTLTVVRGTPLLTLLDKALARPPQDYGDDVALIDEQGAYLGVITTQRLAQLQSQLVAEKMRQLEAQHGTLRRQNESLTALMDQLNHANAELLRARDAAMEADRVKSEFLATMSHELRTPMNAVIGMLDLLVDTPLDSDQRDMLTTARTSAEFLLTLVNEVLDLSKMEAGRLTLHPSDFDLRGTVEDVLAMLAERARVKGLELAALVPAPVPTALRADVDRIRQVLLNLVGNAVKFTSEGHVLVRVSCAEAQAIQAVLRVEVIDTGIGIPAAALGRLFQPFTQIDSSSTRRYGGTGLGLAIAKRLVELMGGQIGVESTEGVGSTFWFTLPLQKTPGAVGQVIPRPTWPPARVLIVEPYVPLRRVLRDLLGSCGIAHGGAADVVGAQAALQEAYQAGTPYHAVVLGGQGTGPEDLQRAREIRRDGRLGSTRLVLLTPIGGAISADELAAAGVNARLSKPVRLRELLQCPQTEPSGLEAGPVPVSAEEPGAATPAAESPDELAVLLAEDNAVNQKVVLKQLRKLGFAPDVVATGAEALAAWQRRAYPIIVMDCYMPEMDGYEATQRIRQEEAGRRGNGGANHALAPLRTYIIAATANAMPGDRDKCLQAGMDDYVSKPIRLGDLRAAIDRGRRGVEAKVALAG